METFLSTKRLKQTCLLMKKYEQNLKYEDKGRTRTNDENMVHFLKNVKLTIS